MPHAIVIGAGPAGSVAAYLLAHANWRVTLIEQHRFPRDKVCGECLSSLGFDVLARIGCADTFRAAAPIVLHRAAVFAPSGESIIVELPRPMWGISRHRFDQMLLNAARDAGAEVLQPMRCEKLNELPRPTVLTRDLESNREENHSSDWILLADGKAGLVPHRPAPTGDLGVKAHFKDVAAPLDCIELFSLDGHYIGVAPIENGCWNVAMSVPQARVKQFAGDLAAMFQQILHENAALARQFSSASRVSRWLSAPLPRFAVQRNWPERVIPLGNAAASLEPIGGEGMGLALRSAELAVQALLSNASPQSIEQSLSNQFSSLWRSRRLACRSAAMLLSSPCVADTLLPLLFTNDRLARAALRFCGK